MSRLVDEFGKDHGEILETAWQDSGLSDVRAYSVYVKYPSPPVPKPPQAQVEAVMNVLAPYVDGPPGFAPQRWPIFRFDHDGEAVMPSDDQVRSLAEQIVAAVRTASGEV